MMQHVSDILSILLVATVVTGMILLLVWMHHFLIDKNSLDDKDKDDFRHQLMNDDNVISEHSVFWKFFERKHQSHTKTKKKKM